MVRSRFERQLKELSDGLLLMGVQCEEGIRASMSALVEGKKEMAEKAIALEAEVDAKEEELRALCLRMLLQQQPVAGDLRFISSALRIITDMERVSDQAADIAEIASQNNFAEEWRKSHIYDMAQTVIKMIADVLLAFIKKDAELAAAVIAYDDVVDSLFDTMLADLVDMICGGREHSAALATQALNLLLVAKYLERMGDHIVNIAESVI